MDPTREVDLSNHHPCPVCMRVLTDQPRCGYCQETADLQKEVARLREALECIPVDFINAIENGEAPVKIFLSLETCKLIQAALREEQP